MKMKTKQKARNLPQDKTEIGTNGVVAARGKRREAMEGNPQNEEGRLNLTSLVPPSLPYRGFPSWPLPSTATTEEAQEMPLHLQPGPCCPGTQPHPTPHVRTETELFCRVTTRRGGRSLLPHLPSGSHPTHAAAQEGHGSLALQGPELAGRKKGARVPSTPRNPRPVLSGAPALQARPTQRPSPGRDCGARDEKGAHRSRGAWRGALGGGGGGAGRLGLARAAKGKGREEAVAAAEAEARWWQQTRCDESLIQTGHWR